MKRTALLRHLRRNGRHLKREGRSHSLSSERGESRRPPSPADPTADSIEFEAEFQRAVKQVMVDMMLADGHIDDAEIEVIRRSRGTP